MRHRAVLSHSALTPIHVVLHKVQKRISILLALLGDWSAFIGVVLILGLGTSWYMIDVGTPLTTERQGPWTGWTSAGRADADPYTRAHFARLGTLQLTAEMTLTFVAFTDDEGRRLHSSCDYNVEGREPGSSWWSLTVFDDRGELIANPAQRYAFTSQSIAMRPDGTFLVALARDARPGNWLPTGGAGRLALVFTTLDPATPLLSNPDDDQKPLPAIHRVQCR
jgi:hypothetical protein